jgi:hypothetical protein
MTDLNINDRARDETVRDSEICCVGHGEELKKWWHSPQQNSISKLEAYSLNRFSGKSDDLEKRWMCIEVYFESWSYITQFYWAPFEIKNKKSPSSGKCHDCIELAHILVLDTNRILTSLYCSHPNQSSIFLLIIKANNGTVIDRSTVGCITYTHVDIHVFRRASSLYARLFRSTCSLLPKDADAPHVYIRKTSTYTSLFHFEPFDIKVTSQPFAG